MLGHVSGVQREPRRRARLGLHRPGCARPARHVLPAVGDASARSPGSRATSTSSRSRPTGTARGTTGSRCGPSSRRAAARRRWTSPGTRTWVSTPTSAAARLSQFYLARVPTAAAGHTLVLNFFDIGDASSTGQLQIVPPPDSNVGANFTGCQWTGNSSTGALGYAANTPTAPWGPLTPIPNCLISGVNGGGGTIWNAQWSTVTIPIPNNYKCNDADPHGMLAQDQLPVRRGSQRHHVVERVSPRRPRPPGAVRNALPPVVPHDPGAWTASPPEPAMDRLQTVPNGVDLAGVSGAGNGRGPGLIPGAAGVGGERAPEADGSSVPVARGVTPTFLAYAVGPVALVLLLVLRHFELVANAPVWSYAAAIYRSADPEPTARAVEGRAAGIVAAPRAGRRARRRGDVGHLPERLGTGAGDGVRVLRVRRSSAVGRRRRGGPALGWSLAGCAVGQMLVFEGWMPSFLSRSQAQTIGFLGAFVFGIAIRMAGAIGEYKERAEAQLAEQTVQAALAATRRRRDDAAPRDYHRAVVENAAEGILTVESRRHDRVVQRRGGGDVRMDRGRDRRADRSAMLIPADLHERRRDVPARPARSAGRRRRAAQGRRGQRACGATEPSSR